MSMCKKELGLNFIWGIRQKIRADGDRLVAEGGKLQAEGDKIRAEVEKLFAEGKKILAEGDKLRTEGNKLWVEGDKIFTDGIIEVYGNIKVEWKNWNEEKESFECHLETGEVFVP